MSDRSWRARHRAIVAIIGLMLSIPLASAAESQLHIWGSTDTPAFASLVEAFEASHPSVDVTYHEVSSNELFEAVTSAKGRTDRSIDLVISSAMDLQVQLVNEGLAAPFSSDVIETLPNWAHWRNELFGFTFEPIILVYNKKALSSYPLPETHSELADLLLNNLPNFISKVGTYDPNSSGTGYLFLTQDALQSDQIFRVIKALSQAQMRTFGYTARIIDAVASGELSLGYNVIGTYALESARKNDNLGILQFRDYTIVMSRTAFIYKYADNPDNAARFLAYLLSTDGQKEIARNSALIPIDPHLRASRLPEGQTNAYLPIKLDIGLLTYLDSLKRKYFLDVWNSIFDQDDEE